MVYLTTGLTQLAAKIGGLGTSNRWTWAALGRGTATPQQSDTQLQDEITTGGGSRVDATSITFSASETELEFAWSFTADFQLTEFGLVDAASGGISLLRDLFTNSTGTPQAFSVRLSDSLQLTIVCFPSDQTRDTSGGLDNPSQVVPDAFFNPVMRWAFDVAYSNVVEHIALGSGSTAAAAAQTTLVAEHAGNALARVSVTPTSAGVVTEWRHTFTMAVANPDLTVREAAVFDAPSGGNMAMRFVYGRDLLLVYRAAPNNPDQYEPVFQMTQASA